MQAIWFLALSDLLINLSAGWFGAAFIIPLSEQKPKVNLNILTGNILMR